MKGDPILRDWKEYTENGQRMRIRVYGGIHYIRGNSAPYFSLTADTERYERGRWREDSCGCMHDEILRHYPELAPLAALHLSYIDGSPGHDSENAHFYACGGTFMDSRWLPNNGPKYGEPATREDCINRLMHHLRVSAEEAIAIYSKWAVYRISPSAYKEGQKAMAAICDTMRPRWKAEADAAIAEFGLIVYGDTAEWEAKKAAQAA